MTSFTRRTLLASSCVSLVAASGCAALDSESTPAHWVTVYLGDRAKTHEVSVTVTNNSGDTLFEKEYTLSDSNEADEDAPFPESTDPETITVTIDGTRFERDWPGFEQEPLPCDDSNWAGVELWIETDQSGNPDLRIESDCQHVTMD